MFEVLSRTLMIVMVAWYVLIVLMIAGGALVVSLPFALLFGVAIWKAFIIAFGAAIATIAVMK